MSYSLFWRSPALPYVQKQTAIDVPAGAVVSNAASLRFTGKGAANYGKIQQENLLRLLENFAGPTEPPYPTVGQTWFDTSVGLLKVAVATPAIPPTVPPSSISPTADWRAMNSTYITAVGEAPPANPVIGDSWFQQTGPKSGVLYVYNGIGRYPLVDWNARAQGMHPALATTNLGIKINQSTFSGSPNYGEAYIHGFTGSTAADVSGTIANSELGTITIPAGLLATARPGRAFIVYDRSGSTLSAVPGSGTVRFFAVRKVGFDSFEYDNNSDWVPLPAYAVQTLLVIGIVDVAEEDDNTTPGILSAELWSTGMFIERSSFLNNTPYPTKTAAAIGGWSQVWPNIETIAGRPEYEEMYNTLMSFIGSPYTYGGSNALDRAVMLTDMFTLDASLYTRIYNQGPTDPLISTGNTGLPARVSPDSQDWDRLLAAARYVVSRLELPSSSVSDVSSISFVQDGLPLAPDIAALPTSDVRVPNSVRMFPTRRHGIASMLSAYTQTVNLLSAAQQNRYLMRGMLGNSSTAGPGNTPSSFPSTVVLSSQQRFQAPGSVFAVNQIHGLQFKFDPALVASRTTERLRGFFYSGQAIQINIVYSSVSTATDVNFTNLVSSVGQLRLTADQLLVMNPGTQVLSQAPIAGGYLALSNTTVTLATFNGSGNYIKLTGSTPSSSQDTIALSLEIYVGAALSSTVEVQWKYINDTETYNNPGPTRVYPMPIAYSASHQTGSTTSGVFNFTAVGT